VAQNIVSSSGAARDPSVRLQGFSGYYRAQMPCSLITFEIVLHMMMMMMILIYVQGKPKYSRPPEGYKDVLS
jgi:hypothetical protein